MARLVVVPLLLALAFTGGGCSILLVRSPEPASPGEPVRCTTSPISPLFDSLGAVTVGIASLALMSLESAMGSSGPSATSGAGVGVTAALVTSAIYGSRQGAACREARARQLPPPCDPLTAGSCGTPTR